MVFESYIYELNGLEWSIEFNNKDPRADHLWEDPKQFSLSLKNFNTKTEISYSLRLFTCP